jgi:hypothetical protein
METAGNQRRGITVFKGWFLVFFLMIGLDRRAWAGPEFPTTLTNVQQIGESAQDGKISSCLIRLEGIVL